MGCNESREHRSSRERRSSQRPPSSPSSSNAWDRGRDTQEEAFPLIRDRHSSSAAAAASNNMGQPSSMPSGGAPGGYRHPSSSSSSPFPAIGLSSFSAMSSQHSRLILELLPFRDTDAFHEWLSGPMVSGSWAEFCRDFQSKHPHEAEVDKARAAQVARDHINGRTPKYLVYHPDKEGWTQEDHVVRFIVAVVADNMLKGLWGEGEWKKKGLEITKAVYEVLSFLRTSSVAVAAVEQNPPGYSD